MNDPKLKDLIDSIHAQDFPQDKIEILTITEGDSEQAKGIGIKRAKGKIIGMFCTDNVIRDRQTFHFVKQFMQLGEDAVFGKNYYYEKNDNSLNRYFSLIGGNDPICYYLGKNDRWSHVESLIITSSYQPSYGCNGFFYRSELIKKTNLDHYYPMDNAMEFIKLSGKQPYRMNSGTIWHRTSDNLVTFLIKRYKYARDLYSDRQDRRWNVIRDSNGNIEYKRLFLFIASTITVIPAMFISARGLIKIRDWAWFWHWPVCIGFLITYTILVIRNLFKYGRLFQVRCPLPV